MPEGLSGPIEQARLWLEEDRSFGGTLWVVGPAGSGKSRLIEEIGQALPAALIIDCAGLTAEQVAAEANQGLGSAPGELPAGARTVLLLKNVQWAGPLLTSTEPERIGRPLALHLSLAVKVPTIIECDRPRTAGLSPRVIALEGPEGEPAAAIPAGAELLVPLAAAQTRHVPLAVWDVLAAAMGSSPAEGGVAGAIATLDEHLRVVRDENGAPTLVAFRDDALRRSLVDIGYLIYATFPPPPDPTTPPAYGGSHLVISKADGTISYTPNFPPDSAIALYRSRHHPNP